MIQQGQTPTEALERFENFCRFLEVVGGATPITTVSQKLAFYFELFPKSWRQKFAMVLRDITNGTEDLKSVTKFMKLMYKAEQATQKRTSDGAPLKESNQGSLSSSNKQKTRAPFGGPHKKNMYTKTTCQGKPPHEWVNCYYNRNGNNYRPELAQGGGDGRGYQGG